VLERASYVPSPCFASESVAKLKMFRNGKMPSHGPKKLNKKVQNRDTAINRKRRKK